MSLPIIDISPLSSENREDWQPVIKQIDSACRELGFFYVVGHGIPQQQFDYTYGGRLEFFFPGENASLMKTANVHIF